MWSKDLWGSPRPSQEIHVVKIIAIGMVRVISNKRCYLPFSLLFSHEYTVRFLRDYVILSFWWLMHLVYLVFKNFPASQFQYLLPYVWIDTPHLNKSSLVSILKSVTDAENDKIWDAQAYFMLDTTSLCGITMIFTPVIRISVFSFWNTWRVTFIE